MSNNRAWHRAWGAGSLQLTPVSQSVERESQPSGVPRRVVAPVRQQFVDSAPAPVADLAPIGIRIAVEAADEDVVDLMLDQVVRQLGAILERKGEAKLAIDSHFLA